jgi:tetratricopeptide (TPR) repeat protein
LHVEPGELDLDRFDAFVERARNALDQGGAADAADDVEAGLSLWRGEPFADIEGEPIAAAEGPRLRERRLSGLELRADALLALGRREELVAELEGLIATEPYRERLREQHILALYRAGRQKEALEAYRTARAALVDELGVEPGASLQELERRILQQDPELAAKARPNLFHEIGAAVDPDEAATQVKVMDFATETLGRERAEELRDAGSALSIDAFATLSR